MFSAEIAHIWTLLNDVPEEDRPKGEELVKFWQTVAWELGQLIDYGKKAVKPSLFFGKMRKGGSQYIFEFSASDLNKPRKNQYNWHGQNVSQWNYAGCVLIEDGRVSSHH